MNNLADYIDRAERGDPEASITGLLRDLKGGRVKHAEVFDHYRKQYAPKIMDLARSFAAGHLFKAQCEDFTQYLDGANYQADFDQYLETRAIFDMGQTAIPEHIMAFIYQRVLVSKGLRYWMSQQPREEQRQRWLRQNEKGGWQWRND